MPKVGGKRKKTKTHDEEEELDSTVPTCKYFLLIYILLYSNNYKKGKSRNIY